MAVIETDNDLLQHIGLTPNEAAAFLYRTRQAVCQGLARNDHYFKPCDILALRLGAEGRAKKSPNGGPISIDAICDYVGRAWGQDAADQVRTGYGQIAASFDPSVYEEIWVVLPDASFLQNYLPDQASLLKGLPRSAPDAKIIYLFASPLEGRAFEPKVEKAEGGPGQVYFLSESLVGAQLTMVIGNPRQAEKAPEFWVLSPSGFQRAVNRSPEITALHLQDTIPKLAETLP